MSAPLPEPNPHIAAMAAYTPGEQPQGGGWVKLNTNENPYPPSPQALAAIRAVVAAEGATLRLYPSPDASPLREAAAKLHAFPAIDILAGNGSDDLLNILIRAYAGPGRPTGMLDPSYSLYPVLAGVFECIDLRDQVCLQGRPAAFQPPVLPRWPCGSRSPSKPLATL